MRRLWEWFLCKTGNHDWTCKAEQGIKPDRDEVENAVKAGTVLRSFRDYAKVYCSRCATESTSSKDWRMRR